MIGSLLSKMRTVAQIVFALSVLLSTPAYAQSIVGTWKDNFGYVWTFRADGRWQVTFSESCGAYFASGTYTASGGSLSVNIDPALIKCASTILNPAGVPQLLSSGSYSVNGNTMVWHVPDDVIFTATTTVPASTPLPPPPTTQTVFTVPTGQLPSAAAQVTATGTFGSANLKVTLDIVKVLQSLPASGFAADTYNVYVVALVPGAVLGQASPALFVKPKAPANWSPLTSSVPAYLENVTQSAVNNQVVIDILTNTNISSLVGTEIYIGYGTSDAEMLNAGRYRGVYKAQ